MGRDQKTTTTASISLREDVPPWIVPHTDSSVAAIHGVEFVIITFVCLITLSSKKYPRTLDVATHRAHNRIQEVV
jgi:hypothetical protein